MNDKLVLHLGYSHVIEFVPHPEVQVVCVGLTKIQFSSADKQLVGEMAATVRRFRSVEPYKGKGIRYVDEKVRLKVGKKVTK